MWQNWAPASFVNPFRGWLEGQNGRWWQGLCSPGLVPDLWCAGVCWWLHWKDFNLAGSAPTALLCASAASLLYVYRGQTSRRGPDPLLPTPSASAQELTDPSLPPVMNGPLHGQGKSRRKEHGQNVRLELCAGAPRSQRPPRRLWSVRTSTSSVFRAPHSSTSLQTSAISPGTGSAGNWECRNWHEKEMRWTDVSVLQKLVLLSPKIFVGWPLLDIACASWHYNLFLQKSKHLAHQRK